MFKTHFDRDALIGEQIFCTVDNIEFIATIEEDDHNPAPDKEDDGFWPSPRGYKTQAQFERAYGRAALVMQAWKDREWCWCGIVVTARILDSEGEPIELVPPYEHALWSIDLNYPMFDKRRRPNTYLREVANDLLHEAIVSAKEALVEHIREKVSMGRRAA